MPQKQSLPQKENIVEKPINQRITSKPKVVRYDLYIRDTTVTFGNKPKRAIAVNGQIPMPTLTFTEGDTAEIYVHNELNEETSLHWHGLFLPNQYDGVPNLTQMPIKPHTTHLYKFAIIQHGTHWYHSHTGLQEQIGMYGSMILRPLTPRGGTSSQTGILRQTYPSARNVRRVGCQSVVQCRMFMVQRKYRARVHTTNPRGVTL